LLTSLSFSFTFQKLKKVFTSNPIAEALLKKGEEAPLNQKERRKLSEIIITAEFAVSRSQT